MTATVSHHRRWNRHFSPSAIPAEQELEHMWKRLNHLHFKGKLPTPKLAVYPPCEDDAGASFVFYPDGFAIVDIDPAIINGTHPDVASLSSDGRRRVIADLLLHEAVHVAVYKTGRWNQQETHAGAFAILAGGISQQLGLPRSRDLHAWPGNVRPAGYYLGANAIPTPLPCSRPRQRPASRTDELIAAIDATTAQI